MKKSQILAALALAFALGVVAPVAGALNASAIDHTAQSATCSEVAHARAVASDETYNSFLKLYNDIAKYTTAPNAANAAATDVSVAGAIRTALSFTGASPAVTVTATPGATANLDTVLTFVNNDNIADYDIYKALYDAINKQSVSEFKTAVANYNGITGVSPVITNRTWTNWAAVLADTAVYDTANTKFKFQNWDKYKALLDAVAAADLYSEGMRVLDSDLIAVGVARDAITAATTANGLKASSLVAIVTPAATPATAIQTKYGNYVGNTTASLRAKLVASEACSVTMENNDKANGTTTVYDLLEGIAGALRTTENGKYGAMTDAEIIDALLGATVSGGSTDPVKPGTPGEGDDNQGGEGDGKGDGVTTPDTGVIANAEGNATSTASIMAGIATALTAAGVGVVAFRNIRRNKKA